MSTGRCAAWRVAAWRAAVVATAWLSVIACGPPPANVASSIAQAAPAGRLLRDDRITLTRGTVIRAVGVSRRWVYAVTPDALFVLDRASNAWLPPFTRDGGFDPSQVRSIAIDPDDESAWLFTGLGAWTVQPLTAFLSRAPAGAAPARLRASTLEAVYREFPSVQSFEGLLTRDDALLASFAVTSGARAPDRSEVWLGTAGNGLFQVDPLFNRATPQPFGLAASGAGAIARAADGIWIAPASRALEPRFAVTFASADLQRWRWLWDVRRIGYAGAQASALAIRDGVMWMGTNRGVFRMALDGTTARAITQADGLPSDRVLSLLARTDGLWVGTERGLAFVPFEISNPEVAIGMQRGLPRVPVYALLATGDMFWIATEDGLYVRRWLMDDFASRPASPDARLRTPVLALTRADSTVFVATRDAMLAYNLASGAWTEPWPAAPWRAAGDITVLAADARTVWAGGAFGVVAVDRASGVSRILRAGSDLPDAVTGLVLDGPHAWIATLGGVVRVRRTADGLFP